MAAPVVTIEQMREWERATWETGQTEAEVIRRVGQAVAQIALRLTKPGDRLLLLAGKGHNGDDVRAAQPFLSDRQVDLLEVIVPEAAGSKLEQFIALGPELVLDGLFGIGLNRTLSPNWINFIETINACKLRVLSIDVPSGLDGNTGRAHGAAVKAQVTLTVGAPKVGLLQEAAWDFTGRLEVAHLVGLAPRSIPTELEWTLKEDFCGFPPARSIASHKGTYGHLGILAGSSGFHGAAVLAARGAQRAQPGLITLHTMENVYPMVAAQLQAVMVSGWRPIQEVPQHYDALLAGPGLAAKPLPEELRTLVRTKWRTFPGAALVDASALDWLPPGTVETSGIRVITPHPGEAARMLGTTTQQVQANRLKALRALSEKFGDCWVVLKGHQTLIGRKTGAVFVNPTGNPYLAQGGSGDVLAGFLAGLLAQPRLAADPSLTLRHGVWQHGAAADRLQQKMSGWVVEDLVEAIGAI